MTGEKTNPCSASLSLIQRHQTNTRTESIRTVAYLRPPLPPLPASPANGDHRPEVSSPDSSAMASLAPHFKWAPSPSAVIHAHHHPASTSPTPSSSGGRCAGRSPFAIHCAVTSAAATVFDSDRVAAGTTLRLVYSSPVTAPVLQVRT